MAQQIELTQGKFAVVDDGEYDELNRDEWYALKKGNTFYAVRNIRLENGKRTLIYMHSRITGYDRCDHVDGDGLNNLRENLRPCSNAQNQHNSRKRIDNTSGYKGVSPHKASGKFQSQIKINGVIKYLGRFAIARDAAIAYNDAAIELHGEFARLNEIEETNG